LRPPPTPTLFPYPSLFRSVVWRGNEWIAVDAPDPRIVSPGCCAHLFIMAGSLAQISGEGARQRAELAGRSPRPSIVHRVFSDQRSEEHTSELQSRENLVCR